MMLCYECRIFNVSIKVSLLFQDMNDLSLNKIDKKDNKKVEDYNCIKYKMFFDSNQLKKYTLSNLGIYLIPYLYFRLNIYITQICNINDKKLSDTKLLR